MTTWREVGSSAVINLVSAFVFLLAFSVWRLQPQNGRVYFPKWYIKGVRKASVITSSTRHVSLSKFVNLDPKAYMKLLTWIPAALKMSEQEIIDHAGLDSAVFLRIFLLGLKIFFPITCAAFAIIVPINMTDDNVAVDSVGTDIDKLSIANVTDKSNRLWAHLVMSYVFTIWTCYVLYIESRTIADMRVRHLITRKRAPDQFTVLVRQVPPVPGKSTQSIVEDFFSRNHPDYLQTEVVYNANKLAKILKKIEVLENWLQFSEIKYERNPTRIPTKKLGFCGMWGKEVDSIDYYTEEIAKLKEQAKMQHGIILDDTKLVMPAAFVSFKSRWAAAVCAQTQQTRNTTKWLTDWAPEPRNVYWRNLAIPYLSLTMRSVLMRGALILLFCSYTPPVLFVQSLANLQYIDKNFKFLRPITRDPFWSNIISGFLPGLALKLFTVVAPFILMMMTKFEGHLSHSTLDTVAAAKFYYFLLISVFLTNVVTGSFATQLSNIVDGKSFVDVLKNFGDIIPTKASFFIGYIMVDGWSGSSWELIRIIPLIFYHIKNAVLVRTPKDRDQAMAPGNLQFNCNIPRLELYFLLGTVYSVMNPLILPFIIVFFCFGYLVFRNQVINVYEPTYDSAAAYWPHIHSRIVASMVIEQLTLLGVFTLKGPIGFVKSHDNLTGTTHKAVAYLRYIFSSTPFMILLPIGTIVFHFYCKSRFDPVFANYPLEDANEKDRQEQKASPDLDLKAYLNRAYENPALKAEEVNIRKEKFIIRRKPDVAGGGVTRAPLTGKDDGDDEGNAARGRGQRREAVRIGVSSPDNDDIEIGAPGEDFKEEERRPSRGHEREAFISVSSPKDDVEGGVPREEFTEGAGAGLGADEVLGDSSRDPTEVFMDALSHQSSLKSGDESPNSSVSSTHS